MDQHAQPDSPTLSKEELADLAHQELETVVKSLKEARRILARDWPQMTPGERSAQSRIVKQIEQQEQALLETIAMNRPI